MQRLHTHPSRDVFLGRFGHNVGRRNEPAPQSAPEQTGDDGQRHDSGVEASGHRDKPAAPVTDTDTRSLLAFTLSPRAVQSVAVSARVYLRTCRTPHLRHLQQRNVIGCNTFRNKQAGSDLSACHPARLLEQQLSKPLQIASAARQTRLKSSKTQHNGSSSVRIKYKCHFYQAYNLKF